MALRGPSKGANRRRSPPEVIRQLQGQARRVAAELLDAPTEEDSTIRPAWPGRSNIEAIFREAQRLKA